MDMREFREQVIEELRLTEPSDATPEEVQRDARPEFIQYRDEGCEVSPSCLSCPLPRCIYDEPGWLRRRAKARRDQELLRLSREEGLGATALARRFGLSRRTVHRILRGG